MAGDPTHFPFLMATTLCESYRYLRHPGIRSPPDPNNSFIDLYQNSFSAAILFLLGKLSWGRKYERLNKCIHKVVELVSWQLNLQEDLIKVRSNTWCFFIGEGLFVDWPVGISSI